MRQHVGMETIQTLSSDALLTHLVEQIWLLADAFRRSDPTAPVPGLEWDVRTVFTHTGAVHRWAADIVARRLVSNETGGSIAFWPPDLNDQQLAVWFEEGAAALVATLREAPADLTCYAFIAGVASRTFWIRRQAHETAIHRADVQAADGGAVTAVDASFAQDGLGEIVGAFATEPGNTSGHAGRLLLQASDGPAWQVTFSSTGNRVVSGDLAGTAADAVVRGTSDQLYRWAWNRPASVTAAGDPAVIARWRAVRVQ